MLKIRLYKEEIPKHLLKYFKPVDPYPDSGQWILRDIIIWAKKVWIAKENKTIGNAIPSSVRDRCAFTYEPIFMLVKSKNYYFDQDAIRVPYTEPLNRWGGDKLKAKGKSEWDKETGQSTYRDRNMRPNILGANRPNVWQVNTEAFSMSHFATFPTSLITGFVQAGCPQWICKKCGQARMRITKPSEEYRGYANYAPLRKIIGLEEFGNYIRKARKKKGLSRKEVAKYFLSKHGKLTGCVWNWENGYSLPNPDNYKKLKEILDLDDRYDKAIFTIWEKNKRWLDKTKQKII